MMRYVNQLAAAACELLGAVTPHDRRLRVLEAGGGTGGTSASLLGSLPPGRFTYRFTDVSEAFLERARQRFGEQPDVEFGLFDLEAELESQGYRAGSFDVIVAANAVHAAKDLRAALRRLHDLLAPGGLLILVESTVHLAYFDMTTGLIEGWQHFTDDLRTDNPLLSVPAWLDALRTTGFERAQAWPEAGSPADVLGQHVVVAQVAGDAVTDLASTSNPQRSSSAAPASSVDARGAWLLQLEGMLPVERLERLREMVRAQVMQVLRLDAGSPPAGRDRLMDLGMDSLMAVQLRNAVNQALALERPLSSTVMFDHPTIDAIAAHLAERIAPAASVPRAAAPAPAVHDVLDAAAVAALSDADIERLLDARLGVE
jgi:SAM-dependent methyltransferase